MLSNILPIICTVLALSFNIRASDSPQTATADLICHTSHVSECYPKLFQPTNKFQVVHDDQDLPPGLHVRINLTTGKKEAKLNVDAESDQRLLASAMDVAIVDPPEPSFDTVGSSQLGSYDIVGTSQLGQKVMDAGGQGSIRPIASNSADGTKFEASKMQIKTATSDKPELISSALDTLEDLSHDIYWGLKLAQDSDVIFKLVSLLSNNNSDSNIKGAAALVFGTAIQNNPAAFTAALSHFYNDEQPSGPMEAILAALIHEQLPQLLTRFVYLLSALCQDQTHLWKFVNGRGLDILTTIFDAENAGQDGKDKLRGKIANFVLDHFLQQDSFHKSEAETAHRQASEEIKSNLGHEDPWIIPDAYDGFYEWPRNTSPKFQPLNIAQKLQPWCGKFSQAYKYFSYRGSTSTSSENVREAHVALQKKLGDFGCTCTKPCEGAKRK
ncbi:hypothetical protein MMC19_003052 [Ptychographa xylographoides]|nr:hypothetical protein [Ptychographa xylographoides]